MNCAELTQTMNSLFGLTGQSDCSYTLDVAGASYEFIEFAYCAKTEELAVQALFLRLVEYATAMAYRWGRAPKDFEFGRTLDRVSVQSDLRKCCLTWRVLPEVRAHEDGVDAYARLVIYEM